EEVHVWRVALDDPGGNLRDASRVLSPDELRRAERLQFEKDRLAFAIGRSALRTILGRLIGEEPGRLSFEYGPSGKPALATPRQVRALEFNVSHSHGLALVAVSWSRCLGVDVEQVRELDGYAEIVGRFFSAREREAFAGIADQTKREAFFRGWVRKEAVLKAKGAGMSLPLDSFDVSLSPGEPAKLLHMEGPPGEAERWSLADLDPATGFVAALAVEGGGWQLVVRDFAG
ncbi:MAG TPA: 4'-phosphopantetheinyl transferase superfamily protein, partial [Pirellulales bacterium]|nr:4'-phosphopantetheinyl transferase superfamily protein [Pirellulales bacterium]